MTFQSELLLLLNGTILGVNFCFAPNNRVTPKTVPFRVSVLAVVTNKVDI